MIESILDMDDVVFVEQAKGINDFGILCNRLLLSKQIKSKRKRDFVNKLIANDLLDALFVGGGRFNLLKLATTDDVVANVLNDYLLDKYAIEAEYLENHSVKFSARCVDLNMNKKSLMLNLLYRYHVQVSTKMEKDVKETIERYVFLLDSDLDSQNLLDVLFGMNWETKSRYHYSSDLFNKNFVNAWAFNRDFMMDEEHRVSVLSPKRFADLIDYFGLSHDRYDSKVIDVEKFGKEQAVKWFIRRMVLVKAWGHLNADQMFNQYGLSGIENVIKSLYPIYENKKQIQTIINNKLKCGLKKGIVFFELG